MRINSWITTSDNAKKLLAQQSIDIVAKKTECEKLKKAEKIIERLTDDLDESLECLVEMSNIEAIRGGCHATYNGGHHEEQTRKAFHHGMDTVCNVLTDIAKPAKLLITRLKGGGGR